jgi:hypothetical protein
MTTDNTKPNFYILLGLNPAEPWDQTKFERALNRKRAEWAGDTLAVGVRSRLAKNYLSLVPEIRRTMEDPELRAIEALTAEVELAEREVKRREEFERALAYINAKDPLEEVDVRRLIEDFKDIFPEEQIRNRIPALRHGPSAFLPSTRRTSILHIRILEEPLTAQNLATIVSTLTELSTKYWLIAKGRFSDLIEYTQTHNGRFAEEANVVISRVSYNSPFNMDWKVDLSTPSVAEALVTTIDGITQRKERLEQAKLANLAKAQEVKEAEQKSERENQMALLEQEKQRLELEQRRLEVLEKQLEVQKKGIEYALEIAGKVVDTLHPGADPATRAMEIQSLLPNLVQLQNVKGLELALPIPPKSTPSRI